MSDELYQVTVVFGNFNTRDLAQKYVDWFKRRKTSWKVIDVRIKGSTSP